MLPLWTVPGGVRATKTGRIIDDGGQGLGRSRRVVICGTQLQFCKVEGSGGDAGPAVRVYLTPLSCS